MSALLTQMENQIHEAEADRELAGLDAIENLLEYAKRDILRSEFVDQIDDFQAKLIEYRSLVHDEIQVRRTNVAVEQEPSPAGGGDITPAVIDGSVAPAPSECGGSET